MEYRPLSMQQQVFFGHINMFKEPMWNQAYYIQLNKEYSYSDINLALNEFLQKNDGARMRITVKDGQPFSYFSEYEETVFEEYSFSSDEEAEGFIEASVNVGFDVDVSLFRCYICRVKEKSGILFVAHHILCDGGSVASLEPVIDAVTSGKEIGSYSYVAHLEKMLKYPTTPKSQLDRKYWEGVFSSPSEALIYSKETLSLDYSSDCFVSCISEKDVKQIREYCQKNQITVQSFLNTVYGIYFAKNKNLSRFTLGIPLSNRISVNDIKTFGLFVQTVPLVCDYRGLSYRDAALKTNDSLMSVYRHFNYSSQLISQEICGGNKLYDVVMEYHRGFIKDGVTVRAFYGGKLATSLEIHLEDNGDKGINVLYRYRKQYFDGSSIENLDRRVQKIIDLFLLSPNSFIDENKTEKAVLCGAKKEIPEGNIYNFFYETAIKNKEKLCIVTENGGLTYGETLTGAAKVGQRLKKLGAVNNDKVILLAERSRAMYLGIYGIMGAGCCYVPLEPDCSAERLDYVINDCSSKILLKQRDVALVGKVSDKVKVICIEDCLEDAQCEITRSDAKCSDLAYVIYTSGTTGAPKGVMVEHRSLINRLKWMQDKYSLEENDVILQKTPYTFDVSLWEMFWWGLYGSSMYVLPKNSHYNMRETVNAIYRGRVTHVHFVPSVYRIFLKYLIDNPDETKKLMTLKHIFLSGEALDAETVNGIKKRLPFVKQHNLYGPTECTVDVTFFDIENKEYSVIPIGVPVDNTEIYIADENMNLLNKGDVGEIIIGGASVGIGYVNNEKLTAEYFIKNPFGEGRLYLTGDKGYVDSSGNIIFCGRKDRQIKLFGQRVELSAVENVIKTLDGVENAVALTDKHNDASGIIAFYTGKKLDNKEVYPVLKDKLPKYAVPTRVCYVDAIPLTSHGKTDVKKLWGSISPSEKSSITPNNRLEEEICNIFARQLKRNEYAPNLKFIDSGASSLDVMSVLCDELLDGLSVDEFCRNSSPCELAKCLTGERNSTQALIPLSISRNEKRVFILFPYAAGGSYSFKALVGSLKDRLLDTSFYCCGWETDLEDAVCEIAEMAERAEIVFFSHCAGIALATELLEKLERHRNYEKIKLTLFASGIVLPYNRAVCFDPWRLLSDKMLVKKLTKAGFAQGDADEKETNKIIDLFRDNAGRYFSFFKKYKGKIKHKTVVILADGDAFTKNYGKAQKIWSRYVDGALEVKFIKCDTHYFLSEKYGLCDVIFDNLNKQEKDK